MPCDVIAYQTVLMVQMKSTAVSIYVGQRQTPSITNIIVKVNKCGSLVMYHNINTGITAKRQAKLY